MIIVSDNIVLPLSRCFTKKVESVEKTSQNNNFFVLNFSRDRNIIWRKIHNVNFYNFVEYMTVKRYYIRFDCDIVLTMKI